MEAPKSNQRVVAELGGARLPADRGLSSLGLLMQLVGSFFLGYMALLALLPVFAGGAPGSWEMFLLGASGAVRSAFHRSAGNALLYGSPTGPLRAVRKYVVVAFAETGLWLLVLTQSKLGLPSQLTFPIAGALIAWPIALLVVASSPAFKRVAEAELPQAEDLGFEGASVLMAILGVMGTLLSAVVVYGMFKAKIWSGGGAIGALLLCVFGMLLVRSIMHARAGIHGTRGLDADGASNSAERYYSFGVVSSVIAGGALLVQMMMTAVHPMALLMVGVVVFWLLIWPLALRRFYTERNFSVILAGDDAPSFRRAPDAGMTALGWLLLMLGSYQLGSLIPTVLLGASGDGMSGGLMGSLGAGISPAGLASAAGRSLWWNVGLGAVQLWAGIELIRMSDRYRFAANLYGIVGSAVTVYVYWPVIKTMGDGFGHLGRGAGAIFQTFGFSMLAIFLVIPVAAVVLANRKLTPEATARIR